MKSESQKQQGFSHILVVVLILAVVAIAGFAYLRIKKTSDKKSTATTNQTSTSTSDNKSVATNSNISQSTPPTTDGPMVLDENTFAGWGLKFVGDKTKASLITFISPVDNTGKDEYTYGFYDNETAGTNGGIVVKTRKKYSKPNQIIAITKDIIDYGKTLKTSTAKTTFSDCIRSPFGGWFDFWTKQQVDEELKLDPQKEGPTYAIAQKLKDSGKLIGNVYAYYQQPTGTCNGAVDAEEANFGAAIQKKVEDNIKSTTQYIIDNLQPL